jgi:hypothetical protein
MHKQEGSTSLINAMQGAELAAVVLWVEMDKGEFHFSLMKTMRNLCEGWVCDDIARRKGACCHSVWNKLQNEIRS